jgi:hypothetical protein
MSLKRVPHIIVALVVALSLVMGATSAMADPGRESPFFLATPDGITWQ